MTTPIRSRWRATPLVQASVALHAGALGWACFQPAHWPLALSAVVADHLLLVAQGLWPRSSLLGPNLSRLPAGTEDGRVVLTFDDGPDPAVTPHVLEILTRHGAHASFFCVGEHARRHPALVREIVAQGHRIENHSARHLYRFSLLGPRAIEREVMAAQEIIADLSGRAPLYFRAPAGLRNVFLDPVLHRHGLRLASWTRRGFDTRERQPARVLARLLRNLAAGDILLLHDGTSLGRAHTPPPALDVLPRLLETIAAHGLRAAPLPETDAPAA